MYKRQYQYSLTVKGRLTSPEEFGNIILRTETGGKIPVSYTHLNSWPQAGAGVIGELEVPETELEFLKRIKKTFEVGCLRHNKLLGREIQTVA